MYDAGAGKNGTGRGKRSAMEGAVQPGRGDARSGCYLHCGQQRTADCTDCRTQKCASLSSVLRLQASDAQVQNKPTALPTDMTLWHDAASPHRSKTRYWDRQLLDRGVHRLGHLSYFKRFFDKLNRGERIVAVAIGSSFVHDFAGCWQTSLQALWDLGIVPNPVRG